MDVQIKWNADGSVEVKNVIRTEDGNVRVWGGPPLNAVLVQIFPALDYEGNPTTQRFVTTLISDPEMEEAVRAEALRIIKP